MVALLALCHLLAGFNFIQQPAKLESFLGFKIGMPASEALTVAGEASRMPDAAGRKQWIVSDTVPITLCKLPMRRSLGFDSTGKLYAVGFTYKTTPGAIQAARNCAYQWLTNFYGPPTNEAIRDSTKQEVWKLAGHDQITLEARGYNPRDYFILIYYYKVPLAQAEKNE